MAKSPSRTKIVCRPERKVQKPRRKPVKAHVRAKPKPIKKKC